MEKLYEIASYVGIGLIGKILFDWLKGSNGNGKTHRMPEECKAQLTRMEVIGGKSRDSDIKMITLLENIRDSLHNNGDLLVQILKNGRDK